MICKFCFCLFLFFYFMRFISCFFGSLLVRSELYVFFTMDFYRFFMFSLQFFSGNNF
jgi:hypothetical protein